MKQIKFIYGSLLALVVLLISCKSGPGAGPGIISTDTATIARGGKSFQQLCSGCHNFKQDGIGPALNGITGQVDAAWLFRFIQDPKKSIDSGDERGKKLFQKYHTVMPSFAAYPETEIKDIISFLNTQKGGNLAKEEDKNALKNPIPDSIKFSGLILGLQPVTQFPASSDSGKMPLTRITKFDELRGVAGSFVLDLRGKLYRLQHGQPQVYMDMAKLKPHFINQPGLATGFGSFAFHPDFASNGLLYTSHTESPASGKADFGYNDSIKVTLQWVLTEWKTQPNGSGSFTGQGRELLRINFVSGIHGMQEITFRPNAKKGDKDFGLLYIGVGDGGSVEEGYPMLAHNVGKIWGTVIRIDPTGRNSANGQYGIPPDNPFAGQKSPNALGEIFAYGFRNPHRISWTRSGQMLVCNVGQANIESVNSVKPGQDFGWPIREGNFLLNPNGDLANVYPLPANDSSFHIQYPVAEFDHDEGKAIAGGYEYLGRSVPELKGKYVFGDIPSGRLFYVNVSDLRPGQQAPVREWKIAVGGKIKSLHELCGSDRVDLHFGRDQQGELYIMTKADGRMYKLTVNTRN